MAEHVIRVATDADFAAAGQLTAEAYLADGLIGDDDGYLGELLDAARRAREATLLVAVLPAAALLGGGPSDGPLGGQLGGQSGGSSADDAETVPVGTLTLAPAGSYYAETAEPGELEVRMLAVAQAARRRGIAEALTRAAMLEAVRVGARGIVLSTLEAMTGAHRLYRRLGFVRAPDRDWRYEDTALRVYTWKVPRGPGLRIEAALWRPVEVRDVDGWRVGLSSGFTRRANSVVALDSPADVAGSISEVEKIYAARGQPATFRVCAQSTPEGLDELLSARGYREVSHTLVMVRGRLDELAGLAELAAAAATGAAAAHSEHGSGRAGGPDTSELTPTPRGISFVASETPDDRWLAGWLAVRGGGAGNERAAAAIVSGSRAIYVRASNGGTTIGVIRAALEQEWVGVSCLVVEPSARGAGIGRALTLEALRLAGARGAERAFLQVAESNEAAIALYAQLGFAPAERYHYRELRLERQTT